jgi:hypothetical protein
MIVYDAGVYSSEQIEAATGADGLAYARNKNRGGRSSAKGRDFEIAYGAYRIALAAASALRSGELGEGVSFRDQVMCFVDDFVELTPTSRTFAQLKSGVAHWGGGDHPLADDFRLQSALDRALGVEARYALVVGDEGRREALLASRPSDLADVEVLSFPEGLDDRALIHRLRDLSEALSELSPREPEDVVREQVWRMLLGSWHGSRGDQNLSDVVDAAAEGPGAVVSPMRPPYELSEAAKIALDNVPGFRFYVRRNFFVYEALSGLQRGIADHHCHTPQFEAFVTKLIEDRPTDFFEFWKVLKAHI